MPERKRAFPYEVFPYLPTYLHTWVGAGNTCVSKNPIESFKLQLHFFHCSIHFSFPCHLSHQAADLTDHLTGGSIRRPIIRRMLHIFCSTMFSMCRKQLCRFIRTSPGMALGGIGRSSCCSLAARGSCHTTMLPPTNLSELPLSGCNVSSSG